jgi:predicted enzyme related to lactoylglutathione lyase
MSRPVHFELTVQDADRAARFYRSIFGWQTTHRDGPGDYWQVRTGEKSTPGIDGGLRLRMPGEPPGVTNTIPVDSVDQTLDTVQAAGGAIVVPPFIIPGICRIAYASNPDGNPFAIVEDAPSAS